MKYRHLIAFLTPLAFAVPAMAWSDDARDRFTQECVMAVEAEHGANKARSYCDCAADNVSQEFSEEELEAMGVQAGIDPAVEERLVAASSSCLDQL